MRAGFHKIWKRAASILLALLLGTFPAVLVYLLFLQLPVISHARLGIAVLFTVLFAYLVLRVFPRWRFFSSANWMFLVLTSGALAFFARDALIHFPERAYLFYGRHELQLSVQARDGQAFAVKGFQTGLGSVGYDSFQNGEGWNRRGNQLVAVSHPSSTLTWKGWTANRTRLDITGSPGTLVTIRWDGQARTIYLGDPERTSLELEETFSISTWSNLLLFVIMWGAVFYGMAFALMFEKENLPALSLSPNRQVQFVSVLLVVFLLTGLMVSMYIPIGADVISPDRDSGVFLYVGQQILKGEIPYRDVWDHKGPLLLYLNALGLFLGGGSAWGVWALELTSGVAAILILFFLMRELMGSVPALFGSLGFGLGLSEALAGGNFSEEYGLLFQVLTLLLFWRFLRVRKDGLLLLMGICVGLGFLLRPNQIDLGVGLGAYFIGKAIAGRFSKVSLRQGFILLGGFLLPLLPTILFFASQRALADMWSAVFVFNRLYVGGINYNLLMNFHVGLYSFPMLGFGLVAGGASLLAILAGGSKDGVSFKFWLVVGISWMADLFLCNMSGDSFSHYFLTWLPYAAMFSALFALFVFRSLAKILPLSWRWIGQIALTVLVLTFLLSSLTRIVSRISRDATQVQANNQNLVMSPTNPVRLLAPYLSGNASLLMWGGESSVNFLAKVSAPSRFVYQYPLMYRSYAAGDLTEEFLLDVGNAMPVIVDASAGNNMVIPLEKSQREAILSTPEGQRQFGHLQPFFDFFDAHYRQATQLSYRDWIVFLPVR